MELPIWYIIVAFFCQCAKTQTSPKIVPFMVSIQRGPSLQEAEHVCGGSYIAPRFILTVAKPMIIKSMIFYWYLENPQLYYVVAGSNNYTYEYHSRWIGTQIGVVDKLFPHKKYWFYHYNIGLIRMRKPFKITTFVDIVKIPPYGKSIFALYKEPCTVIGWGFISKSLSQKGDGTLKFSTERLRLYSDPTCARRLKAFPPYHLCAGLNENFETTCEGAMGSALICNDTQVAVSSFGRVGCGIENGFGHYARIDGHMDWILRTIKENHTTRIQISVFLYIILYFCVFLI